MLHLNPIYKKELKQSARMKNTAIMLFFYNFLLALFGLFALYLIFSGNEAKGTRVQYSDILKIYGIIIGIEFILVLVIIPAMTAGTISGEREKQTLDILLTTRVSTLQIVGGKLGASISMMLLLAFSSLPIVSIVFSIGGVTLFDLAEFMALISVTAIYIGSIGIFFSALCKKTTAATVSSYIMVLFVTGGLALILIGVELISDVQTYSLAMVNPDTAGKYGDSVLLLLVNPIFSFLSLLDRQTGIGSSMVDIWNTSNKMRYVVARHWFEISCAVQLLISVALLWITTCLLKPKKDYK